MIVKIDVNSDIQARAKAEGFDRVKDYVQKLIGDDLAGRRGDDHRKLSQEEWKLRLESLGQGRTGSPLTMTAEKACMPSGKLGFSAKRLLIDTML